MGNAIGNSKPKTKKIKRMKAAIYNPYLDSLGGGERYSMTVAKVLQHEGYRVDVGWKDDSIKGKLEKRFGIDLGKVNFVSSINRGDGYDICFWISDGSIPLLRSRNNILHFQVPFTDVRGKSLLNRTKLLRIRSIVCNSKFTKKFIDREYGISSKVIYPPVDVENIKAKRKENVILYVGRFSQLKQSKRQDVLIKTFKKLCDGGLEGWKLVLAGGVEIGVGNYLKKLKKMSDGYSIEFYESPDYGKVIELFGIARLFWSASGYGIDENKEPDKVEHFGITVVEAMAAKAVPIVFKAGGHNEIVKDTKNGFLWSNTRQLVNISGDLIEKKISTNNIAINAKKSANAFGNDVFSNNVKKLLT